MTGEPWQRKDSDRWRQRRHIERAKNSFQSPWLCSCSRRRRGVGDQPGKKNPDVILRDLGLPAGDGYVVMERLGNIESLALVPIIVLTAREEEFHKQTIAAGGSESVFPEARRPRRAFGRC